MKKYISLILAIIMALSILAPAAYAEEDDDIVYVNFGDSIAYGMIEDGSLYPDYSSERDSFTARFASYLGTERINYARLGMQTTDVLYMIDEQFRADVDNGLIYTDSWNKETYPPFNGVSLDQIHNDIIDADYITLCVGGCDFLLFPNYTYEEAMKAIPDSSAVQARLEAAFKSGKLDKETYKDLKEYLGIKTQEASASVDHVIDLLAGYSDYNEYLHRIVKYMRDLNDDAVIILIGLYLSEEYFGFLVEDDESGKLLHIVNRFIDNMNFVIKDTAVKYNCLYVDTMGIWAKGHTDPQGQIIVYNRMVSVLEGDPTYAGGIDTFAAITDHASKQLGKYFDFATFLSHSNVNSFLYTLKHISNVFFSGILRLLGK